MNNDFEKLKRQLDELSEKMEELGGEVSEDAISRAKKYGHMVKEKGMRAKRFIEERPWPAIGITLLAGMIIGAMISRKWKGYGCNHF